MQSAGEGKRVSWAVRSFKWLIFQKQHVGLLVCGPVSATTYILESQQNQFFLDSLIRFHNKIVVSMPNKPGIQATFNLVFGRWDRL